MREPILDDRAREAIYAAKNAAQAFEIARQSQLEEATSQAAMKAANLASTRLEEKIVDEKRIAEIVHEQFVNVLSKGTEQERAMILARVPYICQDVKDMKDNISDIKGMVKEKEGDIEARVRVIEKQQYKWMGALLILPPIITLLLAWIINTVIK